MLFRRKIILDVLLAYICLFLPRVFAASGSDGDVQSSIKTAYFLVDYGLSTYKSKMVQSNDTGSILSYTAGVNVGVEKNVGLLIRSDSSTINFQLNSSKIASSWRDTVLRYRWGYAYLGGIIGSADFQTTYLGEPLFQGSGSGYGGNLGFFIPVGKNDIITVDVSSVTIGSFIEEEQKDVKMGARTDINIQGNIGLTKNNAIDVIIGYHYRTHTISVESTSNAELHTATYVGFQMGGDF